jgi:hypothetical protein
MYNATVVILQHIPLLQGTKRKKKDKETAKKVFKKRKNTF